MVAQNDLFMILLERSSGIVFTILYLSDFTRLRKRLHSSRLIFNNLTKLTKILYLNIQCNRFCFILIGARALLRVLVTIKNFGQFKK